MANMKLTILGVSGIDKDGKAFENLSMTTGSDAVAGSKNYNMTFWTRDTNATTWVEQEVAEVPFLFTLQYIELRKQMYSPNSIEAYVLIKPMDAGSIRRKAFLNKEQINDLFATRKVTLECDDKMACEDYYVHEIIPRKYADQMYVALKIYSPDKLMTLQEYCKTYTAKRLGTEILESEIGNFGITRGTETTALSYETTKMKHIMSGGKEHIFPYLVQYNESFYDFLARTTNRWGEFLYYEDKKLQIGYSDDVTDVNNYDVMTYPDWNESQPSQKNAGTYVGESPYDDNLLKSVVTQDGYQKVKKTILQAFDSENGADTYWMKKAGQVLTNNKSLTNFLFDSTVDDFVVAAATEVRAKQLNDKNYKEYFKDKKTDHGSIPCHDDAHYSTNSENKGTYNEFSEATPILDSKVYGTILKAEMMAAKNVVSIEFDTVWPNLKLGQVIKIDNEKFIVVEVVGYQPDASKKISQSYYERGYNSKIVKYRVTAIEEVSFTQNTETVTGFYPPMLPTGHVRKSGPQIAVVVDVDDPTRANRVRVEYPWQLSSLISDKDKKTQEKIDEETDDDKRKSLEGKLIKKYEKLKASHLKDYDVSNATPWLLYASASGPNQAGVHGRHYLAEKVMIDYINGNVERPFVVGAASTDVPVPLKTGSAVMRAPNGEQVLVHEGLGKGAAAFIAGLSPGLKLINSFYPFSFMPDDNDKSNSLEGGVEMGDKYGIWSIKGSTDGRNVSISSPWGDVKISAFTGITLSAPNGNIKIEGKNVSISAGNNLTLTSGTNIKNKFFSLYDGSAKHNIVSWTVDLGKAIVKKVATMALSIVDLSLLRSIVELFWKPQEGTLAISSNRFLKLEAGGAKAGFPDNLYKNPAKQLNKDFEKNKEKTLNIGPTLADIVKKVSPIVDHMILNYKNMHKDYLAKISAYTKAVDDLNVYSNAAGQEQVPAPCKGWNDLVSTVWNDQTDIIKESDLEFTDNVGDKKENVNDNACNHIMRSMKGLGRHKNYYIFTKKKQDGAKEFIATMRKEHKQKVLDAANEILKSVKALKNVSLDVFTANWGVNYTFGTFNNHVPADYIKNLQEAFSKNKCQNSAFYQYANDDIRKSSLANFNFHPLALKRRVALNLVEGWGANATEIRKKIDNNAIVDIDAQNAAAVPAKPESDEDFESVKYDLYVSSLSFDHDIPLFKLEKGVGGTLLDKLIENINFIKPIGEYYSWGNAKDGKILFGVGDSYAVQAVQDNLVFNKVRSQCQKGAINKNDLNEEEKRKLANLSAPVVEALKNVGKVAVVEQRRGEINHEEQGEVEHEDNPQEIHNIVLDNNLGGD